MGYTTRFSGKINLSRKLTIKEAKFLLDINEEEINTELAEIEPTIPEKLKGRYMQWVPTVSMDAIVWDDCEKFYNYVEWLEWVCKWLDSIGVKANGELLYSGEEIGDTGSLSVTDNEVVAKEFRDGFEAVTSTPLTLAKLSKIALEIQTGETANG